MRSRPLFFADSVSSIASAVELPAVPAITGMRPCECWTATRISSLCSSTSTVGDSPVVRPPRCRRCLGDVPVDQAPEARHVEATVLVHRGDDATRLPVIMQCSLSGRDSSAFSRPRTAQTRCIAAFFGRSTVPARTPPPSALKARQQLPALHRNAGLDGRP